VIAARWPREDALDDRLLRLDSVSGRLQDGHIRDLPSWLVAGDLLVVNDAATIPASLSATEPGGRHLELRLLGHLGEGLWRGVLFGEGDWRTRTEDRRPPPRLEPGDELTIGPQFAATIEEVDGRTPRLVVVRFSAQGAAFWSSLYRCGRPVQYAYVAGPLEIWHAQTPFASRPWAVEMPSAGRALVWRLLAELRRGGVGIAALTHAAGLSSTGDSLIDAELPFPERFDLPLATVRAIGVARRGGGRVVAVGTTVVRALEGCAALHDGHLVEGEGTTDLRIGPGFRPRIVDGVLTGIHDVGSTHRELLQAFAPEPRIAQAFAYADAHGYVGHEFGDACLVLGAA
jgi:S-adenosylmethionine:tRNA ribosyltransferase-isomerase